MHLTRGQESSASCAAENDISYQGWRVAAVCHIGVLTGFATVFISLPSGYKSNKINWLLKSPKSFSEFDV
jgi:hypothetical protein